MTRKKLGRPAPGRVGGRAASVVALALVATLAACGGAPTAGPGTPSSSSPSSSSSSSSPSSPPSTAAAAVSAAHPCGQSESSPSYQHVMWIWMENESFTSVIGSPDAPYITSLAASCGLALDYRAVSHPSLPNYLAATGGTTFGVTDDAPPASHPISAPSIFSQVAGAGQTWKAYAEAMPANCTRDDAGLYAVRHNPAVYYRSLGASCAANDVPMGPITGGTLWRALHGADFPNFAFVTPDVCHDMHDCSVNQGDTWLSSFLGMVFDSPTYRDGHLAVFVVWDEGTGADNHVPLLVAAPSVATGTRSGVGFTHYSLLRTAEDLLGLPALGQAQQAASMVRPFGL